ncbi:MAG TPA: VCBS repeat-containing protein [Myxococcota bacterium]|jgi:hypothetical protein|nr:VCBS repeat-containing protein [Myxococcota bacterium]
MARCRSCALLAAVAALCLGAPGCANRAKVIFFVHITAPDGTPAAVDALRVTLHHVRLNEIHVLRYPAVDGPTIDFPTSFAARLHGDIVDGDQFEIEVVGESAGADVVSGSTTADADVAKVVDVDLAVLPLASCGDGVVGGTEACDSSDLAGTSCMDLGFTAGMLACAGDCTFDTGACTTAVVCGDGVAGLGEDCDGGDLDGDDCTTIGQGFVGGTLACSATCMFVTAGCQVPPGCGDGVLDTGEQCDTTLPPGATCSTATGGALTMGALACTAGCAFDVTACNECGNGTAEGTEQCDGADLGASDCTTEGFGGGALACTGSCSFDTTGCYDAPTVPVLRLPMNNAYLGSIFVVGSRRPLFDWDPSTSMGGPSLTYDIQYTTDATFATGVTSATTVLTNQTPSVDLTVSMIAPVGARYYWHVRACAGTVCSAYSPARWVNAGRSDRDFNGDGYADVAVGAYTNDAGGSDAGRVYVYFGGSGATVNATADGTLTGVIGDLLGESVAAAGDVNADGYADLVVTGGGSAHVYLGGSGSSFDATEDGSITTVGSAPAAGAGDVNGDGYGDIIAGAAGETVYVAFGAPGTTFPGTVNAVLTTSSPGNGFGAAVSSAGDLNGDGFADLLVGAPTDDAAAANAGAAYVFYGGAGTSVDATSDGTLLGELAGDDFGAAVASAGDANDDGYGDLVVGAPWNDAGAMTAGRAYVYYGGPTFDATPNGTLTGAGAGDEFGYAVSGAGDVNADGADDVLVGAVFSDAGGLLSGAAYVYYGGGVGIFDSVSNGTLLGVAGAILGGAVAGAGDMNGDTYADIIVGASNASMTGSAFVYFGGAGAFNTTADGTLMGAVAGDQFGGAVADGPRRTGLDLQLVLIAARRRRLARPRF